MFPHRGSRNLGVISASFRLGTLICKKIPLAKVRKRNPIPDRLCLWGGGREQPMASLPPCRLALSWWLLVPAYILAVNLDASH